MNSLARMGLFYAIAVGVGHYGWEIFEGVAQFEAMRAGRLAAVGHMEAWDTVWYWRIGLPVMALTALVLGFLEDDHPVISPLILGGCLVLPQMHAIFDGALLHSPLRVLSTVGGRFFAVFLTGFVIAGWIGSAIRHALAVGAMGILKLAGKWKTE